MQKFNIGVIGLGYWGPNLVRVFSNIDEVDCVYAYDIDPQKMKKIKKNFPATYLTDNVESIVNNPEINMVAIATPVSTHFDLAKKALEGDRHVWIEKPMTSTAKESQELVELAKSKNLLLNVDHTFLYTPAVRKVKQIINDGELGNVRNLSSERINLGLIQPDVNVVYDLAVHDISIFNYVLDKNPISASAIGASHVTKKSSLPREEDVHINLVYPDNILAHIHVSWLSPVKIRKMIIGGDKRMIIYDDVEPSEKVKVYNCGVEVDFSKETPLEPIYYSGDILIHCLENYEALQKEAEHFLNCIKNNQQTLTNGIHGLGVVKILEAVNKSLFNSGAKIKICT